MEIKTAVNALSALAQETRLLLFRLLVENGPRGLPAGSIAEILQIPPNTLSFHLAQLIGAGLIQSHREGRRIVYAIEPKGVRSLLSFLSDECCEGRPELCGIASAGDQARKGAKDPGCAGAVPLREGKNEPRR